MKDGTRRKPRVAIVVSHPIQHFCPQYASLAKSTSWDMHVFFGSSAGKDVYFSPGFGQEITWTNLYLDEFAHTFLSPGATLSSPDIDVPNLDGELRGFDPDVVIIYGYWQKLQRRAKHWATVNGRKLYFIADTELHGTAGILRKAARVARGRTRILGVTRVLTVGNANELFYALSGIALDQMTRMNFPIDIRTYAAAYDKKEVRRRASRSAWGLADTDIVVGNVGKFESWKRQADLIRAASLLPAGLPVKILLAGSGPLDADLRALASSLMPQRTVFAGFVHPSELPAFYAACDLYAHVSSYEPHSLAVSEANYMGLPIIVSKACGSYGPTDDVQPGRNGLVYPTASITGLAGAIEHLARDPKTREKFGDASRHYAVQAQALAHGAFLANALVADGFLIGSTSPVPAAHVQHET